jgi:cullin 3
MQPAGRGKQKINIKAFKPAAQVDTNYADGLWKVLDLAFQQIYNKNASNLSYEELYRCGSRKWQPT